MRVVCHTVEEFLVSLLAEGSEHVFQKVVRVSTNRRPLDTDLVKWQVNFQVSTVIDLGEDGQYLLEAGEDCGTDYEETEPESNGMDKANSLRNQVGRCCVEMGLRLLPGIIDL